MPRNPIEAQPPHDDEDLQSLVQRQIEEALQWREEHLDPELDKATDYYFGRPYGDEEDGRSQVVTTEVRDAVQSIMPSLMRVFAGSERVVDFKPQGPEDVEVAKQQTEYINYIFLEDNRGFLALHSAIKDALVRKMGIIKWWWEEKEHTKGSEHTGLLPEDVELLATDPYTEITDQEEHPDGTFDVTLVRTFTEGRVKAEALPPEEFIWSPGARCLEDAGMVGHYTEKSASDLVQMGVPDDMVDEAKGRDTRMSTNRLAVARRIDGDDRALYADEQDESMQLVPYAEVYVRYDEDGDGKAELRRVRCVGKDFEVWDSDVVDHAPFALFMPDPEPHTVVGLSIADYVMDIQRIKSHVTRGMLDSLVANLNPVTEVVEGEVNMKDVLNREIGRVVRTRRPGMMREVATEFVGASALPVLEQLDAQKADRIGVTKASAGLDPDALQSTTRAAVDATVQAAQQRLELIARVLAETGMRDLFKGLLRTVVQHQQEPRIVRLRNEFVRVDPRSWDADKDVVINVALGTGLVEQKVQSLMQIAAKQEEHMQQGSPLVDFSSLRATYARIVELLGYRNADEFFKPFGPEQQQQFEQQQAQNQKPSDTEVLKEIEMAKIQARQQEAMAKLQAEQQQKQAEMQLKMAELQLERMKVVRELGIKEADVDRKSRMDLTDQAIREAETALKAQTTQIDALQKLSQTRVGE